MTANPENQNQDPKQQQTQNKAAPSGQPGKASQPEAQGEVSDQNLDQAAGGKTGREQSATYGY